MRIAGYLQTSLIEWPGKISAVIFVPGCNFRCPYCHNADLVDPQKIKKLPLIAEKEILDDLKKRKQWIDSVVVTGGEPTMQSDLKAFLEKIKKLKFATMVQTNGSKPEMIKLIVNSKPLIVDYLTIDFKDSFTKIQKTLKMILDSGADFELRTTVVPTIHDEKVLLKMARDLSRLTINDSRLTKFPWFLQTFQPKNCLDPKFAKLKPFTKKEMEIFLKAVRKYFPKAKPRNF